MVTFSAVSPRPTLRAIPPHRHNSRVSSRLPICLPSATKSNHPSASDHPDIVRKSLDAELTKGRLLGPIGPSTLPELHISSLGVVPKKHSDKWRLIVDLSHPKAHSVNDGISRDHCSLTYMKVDELVQRVLHLGQGCQLAKIDIESAFRNVPVHPHDRHLLGISWNGERYIDTALPFGLRSAPKIFNALADALEWITTRRGATYLKHFLDDFVTAGHPNTGECAENLELLVDTCDLLGFPIAADKREGPTTCLIFLGIEVDTMLLELRLPVHKLERLKAILRKWSHLKSCRKKELQSLMELLHDASVIIRPGRTFLRRLIELIKGSHNRSASSFLRLNIAARSDIQWWSTFIESWNGLSMMLPLRQQNPEVILTSDASGSWGCGAYCCNGQWLQYQWSHLTAGYDITAKELLPIVFGAAIWGRDWKDKSVLCRCDNEAVVHIINTGTSRDPIAMGLMHCLFFITAKFNLLLSAAHIAGANNELADALSRNKRTLFLSNYPQAIPHGSAVPDSLVNLLVDSRMDWTLPSWSSRFTSIFDQHCQSQQCVVTPQDNDDTVTSTPAPATTHSLQKNQSSASLSASWAKRDLSTRPSNPICQAFAFPKSSNVVPTPLSWTCPDLTMSCEESRPMKRKRISNPDHAFPVTPSLLTSVYQVLLTDPHNCDNIMIWAASLLCFFGFLRSGEISIPNLSSYDPTVHLNYSDISVDNPCNPTIIQVRIKASKTDPFRNGVNIYVGKTGQVLCAVTALLNYLAIRGPVEGILFKFQDNSPLTKSKFVANFRQLLDAAGINSALYAGHSFRIGAATTAAANGVEDSTIQTLGRWKSSAYLSYIRIPPENLAALSMSLCNSRQ